MANIRPIRLSQDIDLFMNVILKGFQYPENPQWSIQIDEREGIVDTIKRRRMTSQYELIQPNEW